MSSTSKAQTGLQKYFPWLLSIGGFIGLIASIVLMIEKVEVLNNPDYIPSCNFNPVLACGSVIDTAQASAFGFPNPIIGILGFASVIVVGVSLLAGMKITQSWYWRALWTGTALGAGFIHWLFFQSVYRINALCPYCMVVWAVTIPIFWYTTLWLLRGGYISLPKKMNAFMQHNHLGILVAWYLIIIGLILNHFWYFFGA